MEEATALLGEIRGPLFCTLADPAQLRRRDEAFLGRCHGALERFGIGGQWRVSPVEDPQMILVSHAPEVRGEPLGGPAAQTTPFRMPAPT